ncbi:CidA/LrgA family protein [Oceanobacter mangrovi]|uniref:CidA/LrgA family protein n=1 Tax=Oceanobacter mangrovi TaxID=2862510 RepID=UPI001C8DAC56|nr:CidA/LrgA family protein [Oceanobacter mangrovi]
MAGFLILLTFLMAGTWLQDLLQLPVPAAICGMLLLLVFLLLRGKVPHSLDTTTRFLSPWLPMFLVPVSVGVTSQAELLQQKGPLLLVILIVSLIPGIIVCGLIMQGGKNKS